MTKHTTEKPDLDMARLTSLPGGQKNLPVPAAIMRHLFMLSCVLERTANRQAERHGLTLPQWMALSCIGFSEKEGVTHSQLCSRLMLSKAPVTGIINRLEREDFVARIADANDKRVSRIIMTEKGEATWKQVRDALRKHAAENCSDLSKGEQETLLSLLSRMLDRVALSDPTMVPQCAHHQK